MTKRSAITQAERRGHRMSGWDKWGDMPRSYSGFDQRRMGLFEAVCLEPGCGAKLGIRGDGYLYNGSALDGPCPGAVAKGA